MTTDIIIIGGGAAGLLSAVYLKKQNPQLNIRILEALPRVAKKLLLTGNGRCNISNKNINLSRYHGDNVSFAEYALNKYDLEFTESFFESIGVDFVFDGDKAFPASLQAGSVVDCLRFAAEELGVLIHTDTKVTNIQILKDKYRSWSDKLSFVCDTVVVAAGLFSGGYKCGSDGSMFELLKKSGFKTVKTTPAIVQLKTENEITYKLAKDAAQAFFDTLKYIDDLEENDDTLDYRYTIQGVFYIVYKQFADKCQEILNSHKSISGYGGLADYEKLRIRDFCRAVDYNFPYGWNRQGKYVAEYGWDPA